MYSVCQKIFSHLYVTHCYQVDPYNEIEKPRADTFQKMFTYCLTCFSITAILKCHSSRQEENINMIAIMHKYIIIWLWRLICSTLLQHIITTHFIMHFKERGSTSLRYQSMDCVCVCVCERARVSL